MPLDACHRSSLVLFIAAVLAPWPSHANELRCDAPRLLIVMDKSSSMLGPVADADTKWEAARAAVESMTAAFEDRVDFGLMLFPAPDECHPGSVVVECAPGTSAAIVDALGDPPPARGNWTPMAESLEVAGAHPALNEAGRRSYVLLVTDGWQWCDPYRPSTRLRPVDVVRELHDQQGITTFVVGFGEAVDFLTLSRAAVAGGSPVPGCDVDADEIGENGCHYQADDLAALTATLGSIARDVTEEVCDGTDNDCDGAVDEPFDADADGVTTCGSAGGRVDCDDQQAAIYPGHEEACDGLDNDCDGEIDTGCDCRADDTRPCGVCGTGEQTCVRGSWAECVARLAPPAETCNGLDDDCDDEIDEGARCPLEGLACVDGACVDLCRPPPDATEAVPVDDVDAGGGCGCGVARGRGVAPGVALLVVLALRRRRRAL